MKKMLVETTGSFMLQDPSGFEVYATRPTVVPVTNFVSQRIALGQLSILADNVEKEDDEFAEYWKECKGDKDFAIQSFLSKPEPEPAPVKEEPKSKASEPTPVKEEPKSKASEPAPVKEEPKPTYSRRGRPSKKAE